VVGAFALYATAGSIGLQLIVGALLAHTGWTLVRGADSAWASDICDAEYSHEPGLEGEPSERDRAYVLFETTGTRVNGVSQALGCVAGSLLAWKFGLRAVMWGQMAAYVPMVFITLRVPEPKLDRHVPKVTAIAMSLRQRHRLVAVIVVASVLSIAINLAVKLMPLYFVSVKLGGDPLKAQDLGYYWPFFFAAAYLVRPVYAEWWRKRLGWYRSLAVLLGITVCCYAVLASKSSIPGLGVACMLSAIMPMYRGGAMQRIKELSEHHERATIMSIHRATGWVITAIVGSVVAAVIGGTGLSIGLLAAGGIIGVLGMSSLGAMVLADRRVDARQQGDPSLIPATETQS
jgi:hypothetical protein